MDIVLTHSLSTKIQHEMFEGLSYTDNRLTDFFQELDEKLDFRFWFSGHYHLSQRYDARHILLYDAIVQLTKSGFLKQFPSYVQLD